ncbi:DNA-3-methyladenine glycosylase family protein [Streptomyces sp. NPDC060194]|uniref:DNA-3-methyladenine glycosylase family protein n=1 Tax=Streptomyces sp. NPDC060194 TaxID=3347069 RepID=UPI003654306A
MPAVTWVPPEPYDLRRTLGVLRRGGGDPTCRVGADGAWWRTSRTPYGPATVRVREDHRDGGVVVGEAWGPGAEWALQKLPGLLGAEDEPGAFVPRHRVTAEAHRRHAGLRLARTGQVMEHLIPAVLEQRVTGGSALSAWQHLVRRYGEAAPGPAPEGMRVTPPPSVWRAIPSWEWHRAQVDPARAATVLRACALAPRLEEAARMDLPRATARLRAVPGVGPWTAAETLQRALGAPDALTLGDLHLPVQITYALTGRRDGTDADLVALLAPYAGQRHRAARLFLLAGPLPDRRSHRAPHTRIAGL